MLQYDWMIRQCGERYARADTHSLFGRATDVLECRDATQTYEDRWCELTAFHVRIQVSTTCNEHSLLTLLGKHLHSFVKSAWGEVTKWREAQHQMPPFVGCGWVVPPFCAARVSLTASSIICGFQVTRRVGQGEGTCMGVTPERRVPLL